MTEPKKILVIDCQASGVAGDMILGALIDLGANVDKIISAIQTLENAEYGYGNIKIKIEKVTQRGVSSNKYRCYLSNCP